MTDDSDFDVLILIRPCRPVEMFPVRLPSTTNIHSLAAQSIQHLANQSGTLLDVLIRVDLSIPAPNYLPILILTQRDVDRVGILLTHLQLHYDVALEIREVEYLDARVIRSLESVRTALSKAGENYDLDAFGVGFAAEELLVCDKCGMNATHRGRAENKWRESFEANHKCILLAFCGETWFLVDDSRFFFFGEVTLVLK